MHSGVILTILTIALSVATLVASVILAVMFYLIRRNKSTRLAKRKAMVKSNPVPVVSSRNLLQMKRNVHRDRLYSDSEDSSPSPFYPRSNLSEQINYSVDELSDTEFPDRRSSSLVSSSSREDPNELFHTPSSSASGSPIMTSRVCILNLSLKYDFHRESLTIDVINTNSPPKLGNFTKGLFIVVQLFRTRSDGETEDMDEVFKTDVKSFSGNVLFNEQFEYENVAHDQLHQTSIRFSLCSHDKFSRVQTLGDFIVNLNEVSLDPVQATVLQRRIQQEVSPIATEEKDKGELFLSLRYQRGSGRINVIVLKATNLKKPKKFMSNDSYVTIKLLHGDQVITKKKTKVKKGMSSPCWNEPFVFDLEEKLEDYLLVFAVKARDLFSSCTKLGTVFIGSKASSTGKSHWNDSVWSKNNTMRQVTMSHRLL